MLASIRLISFSFLASAFAFCGSSADATVSEEDLFELRLGELHLDMTRSDLDRIIGKRTDISEPHFSDLDSFDCGYLAPKTNPVADDPQDSRLPRTVSFTDASYNSYEVSFGRPR